MNAIRADRHRASCFSSLTLLVSVAAFVFCCIAKAEDSSADYADLMRRAETLYAEGSYARARDLYLETAGAFELAGAARRWVEFRVLDCQWRSLAGTERRDTTRSEHPRSELAVLAGAAKRTEDRDRIWAEIQESLGDYHRQPQLHDWQQAWGHYAKALEWWAGSSDLDAARQRYLKIVFDAASDDGYRFEADKKARSELLAALENAAQIAVTPAERATARFRLATVLKSEEEDSDEEEDVEDGRWAQAEEADDRFQRIRRVAREFEAVLAEKFASEWYDDALFLYAEWLSDQGDVVRDDEGSWSIVPNHKKALSLLRRLRAEYDKGETRFYYRARNLIERIAKPSLSVSVASFFLPDSEIQYHVRSRNLDAISFALYSVDLTADVPAHSQQGYWLSRIELARRQAVAEWSETTGDQGDHRVLRLSFRLKTKLKPGAYVLEATAGGIQGRELLLVSDASLVVKTSPSGVLAYFCDVITGAPIAGAKVTLLAAHPKTPRIWESSARATNSDGIATFAVTSTPRRYRFFAARHGSRQAFVRLHDSELGALPARWKIYAYADRPAYRPGETVEWKMIARLEKDGQLSTPSGKEVAYEIRGPSGNQIFAGSCKLNSFGSYWDRLELTEPMQLGEYRIMFRDGRNKRRRFGGATLFRLEEYKLPEFKVAVTTPEENGRRKVFQLGDEIDVKVAADYYFGGPVAGADVEVVIYQRPLETSWQPQREFDWYYAPAPRWRDWGGTANAIERRRMKTDATGRAVVKFRTRRSGDHDFEYQLEARVVDASRREIIGSTSLRVARHPYSVHLRPEHSLYRPQDKVSVVIATRAAEGSAVSASGRLRVMREGNVTRENNGESRGDRKERSPSGAHGTESRALGVVPRQVILETSVTTDASGEATVTFVAPRDGYYRIAWRSFDDRSGPIESEATVWVATESTRNLGHRAGGVNIVLDADSYRTGDTVPVILSVERPNSYVLFRVEADDLYDYELLHVSGNVKLIEVSIEANHVPEVTLSALAVWEHALFSDEERVRVPPRENFLTVDVTSDREEYEPRQHGRLKVTTRDHEGRPTSAEVSLALFDASILYVQRDYAVDPRRFFVPSRRWVRGTMRSSFGELSYVQLALDDLRARAEEWRQERWDVFHESDAEGMETTQLAAVGEGDAVEVRTDFRSTIAWHPAIVTDANGEATIDVSFPDALTSWRASARAATDGNRFGVAETTTRTSLPLIVRLQAPRFFVVGDKVVLSAVINNNTDAPLDATAAIEADGLEILGRYAADEVTSAERTARIAVPAGGEARADWLAHVTEPGTVRVRVLARSDGNADAMEKTYTAYEHGIEKSIAQCGKIRGDDVTLRFQLPQHRQGSSRLDVQVTPSLAVAMLDALPYLIDYPYGCIEQTMSRFLPAVITLRTLKGLGLDPMDTAARAFGGIGEEFRDKTHGGDKQYLGRLDEILQLGLDRVYASQSGDGGWAWWPGGRSDPFMTAYVVWGLSLSAEADLDVRAEVLDAALKFLDQAVVEAESSPDLAAWILHALAREGRRRQRGEIGRFQKRAFRVLWSQRDQLNAYTRALFALAAKDYNLEGRARALARSLTNGVQRDATPGTSVLGSAGQVSSHSAFETAHWGDADGYGTWSNGGVEATAFALRALLAIDPGSELIEPASNWLLQNRRGAHWSNTRDTAIVVLAMNDYLQRSGELETELEYEIQVNGRAIARRTVSPANVLRAPSVFAVDPELLRPRDNVVKIVRRRGRGPLYFSMTARFFSLEEPIEPAGNGIFVRRGYYRIVSRPTLLKGHADDRVELGDGETVSSGERVEVVLTIEAKNRSEYLVFEDLKPAGFETVRVRSGASLRARELSVRGVEVLERRVAPSASDYTGRTRRVHQELRDRKVAFFIDQLEGGVWELRYELRAEVPGEFHALGVLGHAMYVPEIRCNSAEVRVGVVDSE